MPGLDLVLRCAACGSEHALRTGFSLSYGYEPQVCHGCRRLHSIAVEEEIAPGPCPDCGAQLEPWRGRLWRAAGADRLEGPCPSCLALLTDDDVVERTPWE